MKIAVLGFFASMVILILMVAGITPFNLFLILLPLILVVGWWIVAAIAAFALAVIAYLANK